MWKLIDCGTYLWFIKTKLKYHHCVYSNTGEYKKLKVKRTKFPLYSMSDKMYLAYLKTWNLSEAKSILDTKAKKFYINHWKNLNKTVLMKEIIKQLRLT
jgi:hypothetical protein